MDGSASWPELIPGFVLVGIGVGIATPTFSNAAMSAVAVQRGGMAAGAVNTGRQLGFALGIAALGSVFETRAQSVLTDHGVPASSGVARAVAGGQTPVLLHQAPGALRGQLNDAIHAAAVSGVQWAFLVSGSIGVLAGLAVLGLVRIPAAGASHAPRPTEAQPAASTLPQPAELR